MADELFGDLRGQSLRRSPDSTLERPRWIETEAVERRHPHGVDSCGGLVTLSASLASASLVGRATTAATVAAVATARLPDHAEPLAPPPAPIIEL